MIRRKQPHNCPANDDADAVEDAGEKEHYQRQIKIRRDGEDQNAHAKGRDRQQQIATGVTHRGVASGDEHR